MIVSLDHFEEQGRPVLDWFSEYLEQVALVVVVDQDVVFLDQVDVLRDFYIHIGEVFTKTVVVGARDAQELDATGTHTLDCVDYGDCVQGDVLYTRSVVVVDVLLDLGFTFAGCRLVDGHLDILVIVGYDD